MGRLPEPEVDDRLRRLLRNAITHVVPRVVHGQNQGKTAHQRKESVEPQVPVLEMNHIWIECHDAPNQVPAIAKLATGLAQARLGEEAKSHTRVEGGETPL